MKRLIVWAMLLAALAMASQAFAQGGMGGGQGPGPGQGPGRGPGGPGGGFGPDAQLERYAQQLNLTDDQKAKIKPILEDQAKQMQALRDDTSVSQEDRRAKFTTIREATSKQIRALLNADQQKKFDDMQANMRQFGGQRGGPPPAAPPQ
jgi:Spy/CpxP family protein refolding chaperone